MPSLDNPERFDLEQPDNDSPSMVRRSNGDWVSYDDYSTLLADRDALQKRLDEIADIAR